MEMVAMAQALTIDRLLNQVPDAPGVVLDQLRAHPDLASKQDAHGYSLVHAAASYEHANLLNALVREFNVDVNIKDEDGETALFSVETVAMAKALLDLGVDQRLNNVEGLTAAEKLDDVDEQPEVAAFLRQAAGQPNVDAAASIASQTAGANLSVEAAAAGTVNGETNGLHAPPPLPEGVQVNLGTMQADEAGSEPDPDFRRRIEELAAREDFQTDEGQRQLRELVQEAVSGIRHEDDGQPASSRRRLG
ncbi:ankyrin repeat-containing protein [Teratosphaeria destructans]|uniref:Ankyrin repeat-containing protein n=1 Tax=Teratosphaeria destructans TaxID=418781 RepID=A0A9W7SI04_9PEZI|nr:ankyrin repeat-containing protein [Teratosphaeria destructans]